MANTAKALAILVTLVVGTSAIGGVALARSDSPFYPDHFTNPSLPYPSASVGSGIPPQYRLGN